MTAGPDALLHADWSVGSVKRWGARAAREGAGWRVEPLARVDAARLVDEVAARERRWLLGFDFPIGVPAAYGAATGLPAFPALLDAVGEGDWADFARPAERPEQVGPRRPFYPARPGGTSHAHLTAGHGVGTINELLRVCERATPTRSAASSLFWTLGGKQVGKAALAGWFEVLRPLRERLGSALGLWPFDGDLSALLASRAAVVAETYPGEAYAHIGISRATSRAGVKSGKTVQSWRRAATAHLPSWAAARGVVLDPDVAALIADGFGADAEGEDRFDALVGLLSMIEVASGRRPASPPGRALDATWEGWILGQTDEPLGSG